MQFSPLSIGTLIQFAASAALVLAGCSSQKEAEAPQAAGEGDPFAYHPERDLPSSTPEPREAHQPIDEPSSLSEAEPLSSDEEAEQVVLLDNDGARAASGEEGRLAEADHYVLRAEGSEYAQVSVGQEEKSAEEVHRGEGIYIAPSEGDLSAKSVDVLSNSSEARDYERGVELVQAGKYAAAQSYFAQFARKHQGHYLAGGALYWEGACLRALENYSQAERVLQQMLTEYPGSTRRPDALLELGHVYHSLGKREQARATYHEILRHFGRSPAALAVPSEYLPNAQKATP